MLMFMNYEKVKVKVSPIYNPYIGEDTCPGPWAL